MGIDIDIDSTSAIFYTISFLLASQGLLIISNNPHLHIVAASKNPIQMYIDLTYNISIIFLLSFTLRKISYIFGIQQNKNINNQSLLIDVGIMLGLQFYFYDVSANMKAAIYTMFLLALYLRAIGKYMLGVLAKPIEVLGQGILYSVFLVLALKIELVTAYYKKQTLQPQIQPSSSSSSSINTHTHTHTKFIPPNIQFPSSSQ